MLQTLSPIVFSETVYLFTINPVIINNLHVISVAIATTIIYNSCLQIPYQNIQNANELIKKREGGDLIYTKDLIVKFY